MNQDLKTMSIKRLNTTTAWLLMVCLLLLYSCKKTDTFYEKLDGLLQVDVSKERAYSTNYVVGDTLIVYGRLKAKQNLEVWINRVKGAIIQTDSVLYYTSERDSAYMDRVSVLISESMLGQNIPVEFRNGELRGTGPSIDVLSYYGENSFKQELTQQLIYTFPDPNNIFLYCASGKGDVYYYAQADKLIRHISKDGTADVVLDLSGPFPDGSTMQEFIAGGVDPGNQNLFFSVHTDKGYSLYSLALRSGQLLLLNASDRIDKPFSGKLNSVKIIVTSIYPDKGGNLFLCIGNSILDPGVTKKLPSALAYYAASDQSFSYLYKWDGSITGLPAELLPQNTTHRGWRLNPDEKLLYVISENTINSSTGIDVYELRSRVKIKSAVFTSDVSGQGNPFRFVADFYNLRIALATQKPDFCFGMMPMPGNRLQALLYQSYKDNRNRLGSDHDFPKWTVFDFTNSRTYAYAKGKFNQGNYAFNPTNYLLPKNNFVDELLNWDEEGHLYMSANGKIVLLKTKTQ